MKVLLINPPRDNEILGNNPSIVEEERGFNPPLGLLYLAGYLEKHANHNIKVLDCQAERLDYSALKSKITEIGPDVVGLTAMTFTLIDVMKTANIAKEVNKNIRVVLGGVHVYLFPEETIRFKDVDYLVLGEGEEAFKELLDNLNDKAGLKKIPGLCLKDNGNIVNTGIRALIKNLDELPSPARGLTPYKKYTSLLAKRNPVTTVFTSRGCPFRCSFCARPHLGKIFRAQSAERVADELEECVKMGIHEFIFYDDTFTVDKHRVMDLCREITKRKLDIGWDIRARVDTVDEEMLAHLKTAGCQGIHYGVEAGTEKVLEVLNKGIKFSQVRNAFDLTKKYKIPTLAYFMIGNPEETEDDIHETFKALKALDPDYAHITIFTPFPGTEIYLNGLKKGIIEKDYWREFARNPDPAFVAPHWDKIFTRGELNALLIKGYKDFYIRLPYIIKRMKALRSFGEFKRKISAGLKIIRMR